jgi:hypothetical protein
MLHRSSTGVVFACASLLIGALVGCGGSGKGGAAGGMDATDGGALGFDSSASGSSSGSSTDGSGSESGSSSGSNNASSDGGDAGSDSAAPACTFVSTKDVCKTCSGDADCSAGNYCVGDGQGGGKFFCAPDCTTGACPIGDKCAYAAIDIDNDHAHSVCYPSSGTCVTEKAVATTDLCKSCTLDSECGSGSCVYDGLTSGSYCAPSCIGASCPKGDVCVTVSDADPGAGSFQPTVCYPESGTCTKPDAGRPPPAAGCQGSCSSDGDCKGGEVCIVTAESVGLTNVTKSQCMPTCTKGSTCPQAGARCESGMDADGSSSYEVCAPGWACCL